MGDHVAAMTQIPPDGHDHPEGDGQPRRLWDGAAWTDHRHVPGRPRALPEAVSLPEAERRRRRRRALIVTIAGVALVIGLIAWSNARNGSGGVQPLNYDPADYQRVAKVCQAEADEGAGATAGQQLDQVPEIQKGRWIKISSACMVRRWGNRPPLLNR
jgi:hypothetical protein